MWSPRVGLLDKIKGIPKYYFLKKMLVRVYFSSTHVVLIEENK